MYPALLLGPASQSINVASLRTVASNISEQHAGRGARGKHSARVLLYCRQRSGIAQDGPAGLAKDAAEVPEALADAGVPEPEAEQLRRGLRLLRLGGYGLAARLPGFVEGGDLGDAATGRRKAGEVAASAEMGVAAVLRLSATAATSQLPPAASQEASVTLTAHLRDTDGEVAPLAVLTSQRRVRKPRLRLGASIWGL